MSLRKEKEPLMTNWGRISRIPFELRFPQHTIPANSKEWNITERVVDHPRLLLFYMECASWRNCVMSNYLLTTVLMICFLPFVGIGISLVFLILLLKYVRFNTWKHCLILINPNNVSQWHGWIRLLEHGGFSNLDLIIDILKRDNRSTFNYQNVSNLFDMDENTLRQHWNKSKGSVELLIRKLGPLLQMESSIDFDNLLDPEIEITDEGSTNGKSVTRNVQIPSKILSVQQSGSDSIALKEKYVSVMKEELEEREKLVAAAEENEKKMAELRIQNDKLKSECRKLKLERSRMSIVLEEKDDEIQNLKNQAEKKE